jgi:hypothetical protein
LSEIIKETIVSKENTTAQVEPRARGEAPQKVYDKKKTIFRFDQVVWYVLGVIEVFLVFRLALKALGANPVAGFTSIVYGFTNALVIPFKGILGVFVSGNSVVDWSTVIAAIVYLVVAWGLVYLIDLIYPITPKDTGGGD